MKFWLSLPLLLPRHGFGLATIGRAAARGRAFSGKRLEYAPYSANTQAAATSWSPKRIEIVSSTLDEFDGSLIIIPMIQREDGEIISEFDEYAQSVDAATEGAVSELVAAEEFKGKAGSSAVLRLPKLRIALFGLGDKASSAAIGKYITDMSKAHKANVIGIGGSSLGDDYEKLYTACFEASYVDNRFRTGDAVIEPPPLEKIVFFNHHHHQEENAALSTAHAIACGVGLARDVVNAPANVVTPKSLAGVALDLAQAYPHLLSCKILDAQECEKRKMGAYLGVAKGSAPESSEAQFIHLTYTGPSSKDTSTTLAMIGKGLTYDSGGYNIKPSAGGMIEKMKFDMGGSAAVLGTAKSLAEMKLKDCTVHFIVAACENMIGPHAMRPGDILTASNGRTIEVINTDAEGRLTLADALIYAESECKPDAIVDLATLTGAMIIALGEKCAGLFTPNDDLATELTDAAHSAGEKLWRMPLETEYSDQLKSKIADLKNVGGRPAGSITAALFLKEFVSKDLPWAHMDIAGPVWDTKDDTATGYGVKTLVAWARARSS
uniref:Cytosol aminopeptidase domain-containing protein n=1 Tax=Aureoumbra lagunensis TaxID=44058 RepID=A0A7S3JUH3_9STRA|mmetsp:Transcript_3023/g.4710  ORF Transcript_3023/g.4710 Transcript_3023/m.4710 type:complete len:550 (-) Transcript_3023:279-1928(-)